MKTVLAVKINDEASFGVVLEHANTLTLDQMEDAIKVMWDNTTGLPLSSLVILLQAPYQEADALLIVNDNGVDVASIIDVSVMFESSPNYSDDDIVEVTRVVDLMVNYVD